jgi:hypothetical protein
MKKLKNRIIFDIESTDGKLKYSFNKKVNLHDGGILYLLGDMTNMILGGFSDKTDGVVTDIFDDTIKILNGGGLMIGEFDFKYTYKEKEMNGFTKYAPLSIAQITSVLHGRSNLKNEISESSFIKASLSFYDFCSDNNISWTNLYFLRDKELLKKHPILKEDLPIGY